MHDNLPDDNFYMAQALSLAESVLYLTDPNPRVGCLIVSDGQILGQGATQVAGGPHAEVMAIRDAYEKGAAKKIAGATFYVSLEPCSHYGRTPPCVDAIIQERPRRVVIAMTDPNPLVGGQGVAKLRAAGIDVTLNVLSEQALALNPGFVSRMAQLRPWVWSKIACSLDGQIALANGQSQWITGAQARADGHHWRARSSVVLTGLGTVMYDNPSLNVRYVETSRQPIRAVIDSQFAIDEERLLFDGAPVWLLVNRVDEAKAERLAAKNVEVIVVPPCDDGGVRGIGMGVSASRMGTSGVGASGAGASGVGASGVGTSGVGTSGVGTSGVGASGAGASGSSVARCDQAQHTQVEAHLGSRLEINAPEPIQEALANHVNLHMVMRILAERGVNEVHVEAGPGLNGALLQAGLLDELLVYMAPMVLGPGQGAFKVAALNDLQESFNFKFIEQLPLGSDIRLRLRDVQRWQELMAAIQGA